ncbi:alpha/beta hydrolase [Myxococcus sp. CA056]|uniref:alpha/beta fold hydrolase n=1 Tax=unclassified Myxococcus TaxID=2648731 RepID=UPI00157A4689|nr:alpha/beta hydrolase [Myxococcus sp. CA056]NTX56294.1 alpha/beta hydrolase [Myxococcus sp. CA039A]
MSTSLESRFVDAQGLRLHVRWRPGADTAPAVLFLHGWLDHSHSFDGVIEHVPAHWRLALLDFRGMGQSAHAPPEAHYQSGDHLLDMEAALDGLGLGKAHLVGHSLGGIVALTYAAVRPERVLGLSLIESMGPTGGPPEVAVARLRGFMNDSRRPPNRKRYPDVASAAARLRENNPSLPEAAALHLAEHGTEPYEGGVAFTFDSRHRRRFAQGYDEAQWLALQAALTCPVQLIRGQEGLWPDAPKLDRRVLALRTLVAPPQMIPGGHHVHMEQPAEVARALADFIR